MNPMLIPITDSLYALQVPIPYPMKYVTVLIDTTSPVTLIDTSLNTPEAVATLEAGLKELNLTFQDVERIIVTHHHPDHYGLAGWLQQQSNAPILMLQEEVDRGEKYWSRWDYWRNEHDQHLLSHGMPEQSQNGLGHAMTQSRNRMVLGEVTPVQIGDRLSLSGTEFEVLWLPGHADGHLGLWNPELSLLIAGDVILERITPNIGRYAYTRADPLGDYFETLKKVEALQPERTVIGHYGPVIFNAAERAREIADHHHERLEECLELLATPMNAYDLSLKLFQRELDTFGRRFALAEVIAHLEHLRLRGALKMEKVDGVWQYWRA